MSPLEEAIATLVGREPTSEEIQRFYKIKEACGLGDHDAMWAVLLAFGHYEILYGEIPAKIKAMSIETLADHKLALERTADASGSLVKQSLARAVETSAAQMAEAVLGQARRQTSTIAKVAFASSIGVAAVAVLLVSIAMFSMGARTSAAEAAWLKTPEGTAARDFSKLNNIRAMQECAAPFQRQVSNEGTYCIPYDANDRKMFGWRLK
jgi:hypothetical protein